VAVPTVPAVAGGHLNARRRGRAAGPAAQRTRKKGSAGYLFVSAYFVLLMAFGVAPTAYALYLAITSAGGHFVGLSNFISTGKDFRFVPAFEHIGEYLFIWLASLVVIVLGLALLLHSIARRVSSVFRFLFYIPGALAGAASVLVWLFMLDPSVSPWRFLLSGLGFSDLSQTIEPAHLPVIFAIIAFWTGAGGWIVVTYGALNNIPHELLEAARLDGAGAWQTALRVKLPLIKKWVVYMLILAFATGTQLFVEPQLVSEASLGQISPSWSPNELAYVLAFQNDNFNKAAAISVDLLVLGLLCAVVLVFRTKLFEVE
jgi:multiple sugar transport system permease protein